MFFVVPECRLWNWRAIGTKFGTVTHVDPRKQTGCSWLQTFHPSNPEGSQQHISLITNRFNGFAFIIQFKLKGYLQSLFYLFILF